MDYLKDHADETLTVDDISRALSSDGVSRSAIYRNLSALESNGAIKRVTRNGTKKIFYQFSGCDDCHGHLHLSCTKCGKTFHMDLAATETLAHDVLRESDFELDKGNTVLYGICSDCK
ncbi:MAG: transcriptional repressor [Clostridiales bacterium]|nr:transcriptional repressor [Clostridiales bacterium]